MKLADVERLLKAEVLVAPVDASVEITAAGAADLISMYWHSSRNEPFAYRPYQPTSGDSG